MVGVRGAPVCGHGHASGSTGDPCNRDPVPASFHHMGFFDKAKQFMGGKGMANVTITVIERQPAESATFPITDSVLKGTMVIDVQQNCTLLATKYELWLHVKGTDGVEHPNFVCSSKDPAPNTSYGPGCLIMPCDLTEGQTITHPWMVMDVDLPSVLAKNGIHDPNTAVNSGRVRLSVKCIADVKGSPFDPSAEVDVRLIAT
jgi:hypothetical protein